MSLESWKAEFYPVSAKKPRSDVARLRHSIRKWVGLRKANLKKHECHKDEVDDSLWYTDKGPFSVDTTSCALCEKYFDHAHEDDGQCRGCPLKNTLGSRCDDLKNGQEMPYTVWLDSSNPEPMIIALCASLLRVDKKFAQIVYDAIHMPADTLTITNWALEAVNGNKKIFDFIIDDVLRGGKP
jgi:hypothetical protein